MLPIPNKKYQKTKNYNRIINSLQSINYKPLTTIFSYNQQIIKKDPKQMLHPLLKWAQRKQKIFIEIGLRDLTDQKIDLSENKIIFHGISDGQKYMFDIQLFAAIDVQQSKWNKTGFHLLIVLGKKEVNQPYWVRLTKNSVKNQFIQIDWAKWIDEDDEEDQAEKGMGAIDPSQMKAFKGYPGMDQHADDEQSDQFQQPQQQSSTQQPCPPPQPQAQTEDFPQTPAQKKQN